MVGDLENKKTPKDLRYRRQFFPHAEGMVFDVSEKGFVPVPIILLPHLRSLEQKHFIATHTASGKTFFLIHDPRVAIGHLLETGKLNEQELFEINELYADLNQKPASHPQNKPVSAAGADPDAERRHV